MGSGTKNWLWAAANIWGDHHTRPSNNLLYMLVTFSHLFTRVSGSWPTIRVPIQYGWIQTLVFPCKIWISLWWSIDSDLPSDYSSVLPMGAVGLTPGCKPRPNSSSCWDVHLPMVATHLAIGITPLFFDPCLQQIALLVTSSRCWGMHWHLISRSILLLIITYQPWTS